MITKLLLTWRLDRIRGERVQIYKAMNEGSYIPKARYIAYTNRLRELQQEERALEEAISIIT